MNSARKRPPRSAVRLSSPGAEETLRLYVQPIPILELLGVVAPDWDRTEVTPSPAFFYSARPVGAMAFRDYLLDGLEPSREGPVFTVRARDVALQLEHDCAFQGFGEDALLGFYSVATSIVTDLRPGELDRVWEGLEDWSCVRDLDPVGREWLAFFKSVGRRDVGEIAARVPQLMAEPDHLTPARARYLVAVGMVAHLALGNPAEAQALWEAEGPRLFRGPDDVTVLFRYLVQIAAARDAVRG